MGIGQSDQKQSTAAREAARAVRLAKVPPHQTELTKIQNMFMSILRELKQEAGSNLEPAKALTKEIIGKMMMELSKGQEALTPFVTPEQITDAILDRVDNDALAPEKIAEFRAGVAALFEGLPLAIGTHDE